jgi:hypothetical protein
MSPYRIAPTLLAAAAAAALAACTSVLAPRPDVSRTFVLHPVVAAPSGPALAATVGLGPVALPGYVRRPELLTRTSASEVTPSDVARWGEPLAEALPRVLERDLAAALGVAQLTVHPWYRADQPAVQVALDVQRFEREGDAGVVAARYEVRALRPGGRRLVRATELRAPAASADPAATADALSAALGALAAELAAAVREVAGAP